MVRPDYDPGQPGLDRETRLEALELLTEVLTWSRSDRGWTRVAEALGTVTAAVTAGDRLATLDALLWLAELSPVRTGRVGDPATAGPPPESIVERVTHLQYAVRLAESAPTAAGPDHAGGASGSRGPA